MGKANIVATGVQLEEYVFDNQKGVTENTEEDDTIHIKPEMIVAGIGAVVVLAGIIFAGKYLYDNMYIIRHNLSVKSDRRSRFKEIKKRKERRRRRRF